MARPTPLARQRSGFTLIELLVVITIIAVLIGLRPVPLPADCGRAGPYAGICNKPANPTVSSSGTVWRKMFGSSHPSGTNLLLMDGSVRSVKFTVSPDTFRKLAVIDDQGVIDAGSY